MENNKIGKIKFSENGLVPAIAVDFETNEVLMQAYMNADSLKLTIETGEAHYFSRSRNKLWKKGETSGNMQRVVEVLADCDFDSLLIKVRQAGVACHTGERSCFFNSIKTFETLGSVNDAYDVYRTIEKRAKNPVEGSYTNYLLSKGNEKICKKVGEESSECIIAAMKGDKSELSCELADLFYHASVLMFNNGISYADVNNVLKSRKNLPPKKRNS